MTAAPRSVWLPIAVAALLVFGWRIWNVPLTNWDEGIYANVNLELWRSHDWTKLTYFGQNFLEKPPLQFWLTWPLIGLLGPTELAMRLWPVAAGVATAVLLGWWAWQASRNRWLAWLVAIIFISGRFVVNHAFRTGDLDGLLTWFIAFALYSYWRAADRPRWWIGWGAATGLAIMTKSLAGLIPIMVAGLDILVGWRWKTLTWKHVSWGALALAVIAAPWHLVETIRFGQTFWRDYLGFHVLERAAEPLFNRTAWWWYWSAIRTQFFPFSLFLPLALVLAIRRAWLDRSSLDRLLVIWFFVVLTVFSIIQTRREWYILPLYPAAALLVGRMIDDLWRRRQPRWVTAVFWMSVVAMFGALLTGLHPSRVLWNVTPFRILPSDWWGDEIGRWTVAVLSAGLLWLLAWLIRRYRGLGLRRWSVMLVIGVTVYLAAAWIGLSLRHLPSALALKTVAARVERMKTTALSVVGVNLKGQPAGYFYLRRMDDVQVPEQPSGTPPASPVVLTTTEPKNAPLNTEGRVILKQPPFVLLDLSR